MVLDLNKEMAWVTFADDGWQTKWFPISTITGVQLEWTDTDGSGWTYFGIAPTSQVLMNNAVRDNF
jgi:hypothetical protein